ncbi:Odorant receptor 13a [Formica fusca]
MDADRDLNFAIGWNRFNLGLVGIWPDPLQNSKRGLSRCRFLTASFFMLGFMCIPQSVNLVFIWGNADMMTENLATANIPVANAFMKAFTIWHHRKALKLLVDFFYQDWHAPKTSEERTVMLKSAKLVRKISICGTVSYTGSDSFISMLVLHVCSQLQNLRGRLKNLANNPSGVGTVEEFKNELRRIVKRHEHLNWFAKTIEDSFNTVFLIQMLSCTIQLCFQGFHVFRVLS